MRFPPFLMKRLSVLVQPTTPQAQGISGQLIQFPLFCLIQLPCAGTGQSRKNTEVVLTLKVSFLLEIPLGNALFLAVIPQGQAILPTYRKSSFQVFSHLRKKWHLSSSAQPPRNYPDLLCQQSIKSSTKAWNTEITASKVFCWYLEFSV